jgi:hypothetical protein
MRHVMLPDEIKSDADALRSQFLEKSGYSRNDLLAWNFATRRFMTKNGGQYELTEDGEILHFAGPSPDPEDRL